MALRQFRVLLEHHRCQFARQSGAPLLRFADLTTDVLLLDWARELAPVMLEKHPELAQRHIDRWLGTKAEYLKA